MPDRPEIRIVHQTEPFVPEALAAVHQKAFALLDQKGWSAEAIAAVLDDKGGLAVLARLDDVVEGFALFRQTLDEAELITLAVNPERQRLGLARQLLEAAFAHLTVQACTSIFLEVRSDNDAAIALYEKHGVLFRST